MRSLHAAKIDFLFGLLTALCASYDVALLYFEETVSAGEQRKWNGEIMSEEFVGN